MLSLSTMLNCLQNSVDGGHLFTGYHYQIYPPAPLKNTLGKLYVHKSMQPYPEEQEVIVCGLCDEL